MAAAPTSSPPRNSAATSPPTSTEAARLRSAASLQIPIPASITALSSANAACVPNGTNTWAGCLTALNGHVPTSAFNSIASNLVKQYVPAANSGTYGYVFNSVTVTSANQYIGRVDYNLSPKNQLTVLGVYSKSAVTDTLPFTGGTLPGFGDQNTTQVQQYTLDYVHQFSPTLVNDFAAHYTRFNYQAVFPQKAVLPSSARLRDQPAGHLRRRSAVHGSHQLLLAGLLDQRSSAAYRSGDPG